MRILLLEDNPVNQTLIASQLKKLGHQVDTVSNGQQGFLRATSNQYDIFLCDILMPHWDGFKFIEAMTVVCPTMPIVVISSSIATNDLVNKLKPYSNICAILAKPLDMVKLSAILQETSSQSHENLGKMARIVCTIGPSSNKQEVINKMIMAGMDVARLNFSHGSYESHEKVLNMIRHAEKEWMRPVAVLMDLCGPKIRTGNMQDGMATLVPGEMVIIQAADIEGTSQRFSTIAPEILGDLRVGDPILLDDGLLELKVEKAGVNEVHCRVLVGGKLKSHKGINLPATPLSLPCLTAKDKADLAWGMEHSVDFVALSFVRSVDDIVELKELIRKTGTRKIHVVAKIEKPEAMENIDAIIDATDVIMIARGDLGVEIPASRVPWIQRQIIKKCWEKNKPVITATQMLETMTQNARPTRAEVTDVSLAIQEGTDAVMLSGETAAGVDPVNVVRTMASIICESERHLEQKLDHNQILVDKTDINPALSAAASLGLAAATLVIDFGNNLYQHMSKWNRRTPTLLATNSIHSARHACIYKNVIPIITKEELSRDQLVFWAISEAKDRGYLVGGDILAVVEGARKTQGGIDQMGAFQLIRVA
ncbi:MAG: pyruvate kinase [Desulfobulbaceae bacterium]|nr:pyruvate kinase [Desulfobulbaceae bacterium]